MTIRAPIQLSWLSPCVALAAVCAGTLSGTLSGADAAYPFAMCSNGSILTNPAYATAMLDAGAHMARVDGSFATVRAKPGDDPAQWNWTAFEGMRTLRQAHPELDLLPILGYGPEWAEDARFKDVKGNDPSHPPRGIDVMPVTDPANLYGNYVFETVKRYKDVIHCWESWNEPDLPGHAFFKGDGHDFLPYQRACYLAAKAADPHCTVVFAGLCYASFEGYLATHGLKPPTPYPPTSCFFEEYLEACAKDPEAAKNHYYFDVLNQHSYSRASDLYDYVAVLRKLCADHIHSDPTVWITEMGTPDQPGPFGCAPDQYGDYLLQSFAWGSLSHVQRFFHFQLDNSNGHGLYADGLGAAKPALTTYRDVLVKEFASAHFVAQVHGHAGIGFLDGKTPFAGDDHDGWAAFEFTTENQRKIIAFATGDGAVTASIPAKAASAELVDHNGMRTPINASGGSYAVALTGSTNLAGWPTIDDPKAKAMGKPEHLVGGATVIIVETAK